MKNIIVTFLMLVGLAAFVQAEIPERPVPAQLVNDFAGVLSNNQRDGLENSLEKFARQTSTQILVVTVPDLEGYDKADYAFQLGEKWGVGQKGKDNGIVVLLKPKTGNGRGEIFVATGYGLEGVLPDAIVNRDIVNNEMLPRFKENNYYEGLAAGISVIMDITRGEYSADEYRQKVEAGGAAGIPFLIIIFAVLISLFGRSRRRRFYSSGSLPFWMAMGMMSGNHRSSGSFGNFSSGGGNFGGFGGFGGGSFGGGGAGGSW